MKKIFILLLSLPVFGWAQTIGYLRYDSVKIEKVGGNGELILLNGTRGVTGGVLTNTGGGRTAFVAPAVNVNIYNSNGTIGADRTVAGNGKSFTWNNTNGWILNSTDDVVLTVNTSGSSQFGLGDNNLAAAVSLSGRESHLDMFPDSIILKPGLGNFRIDSLNAGTSADSILTWNKITGQVHRVSQSSVVSAPQSISALTAATGANDINNANNNQIWRWNSLASGYGLLLASTSTAYNGNIFSSQISGANSSSGLTTINALISNQRTGTTSTNIALKLLASGGTNNFGLQIQDGSQAAGYVFKSDANGIGSWVNPSSIVSGNTLQQVFNSEIGGSILTKDDSVAMATHNLVLLNGKLGIGAGSPAAALTITGNVAASSELEIHNPYAAGINIYTHAASSPTFRAPSFAFNKSRGTQASPTAVGINDLLGYLQWWGYDGSQYTEGSVIESVTSQSWSSGASGTDINFYNNSNGSNSLHLSMKIGNGKNIGMGTFNEATTLGSILNIFGNAAVGINYGPIAAPTNGLIVEGKTGIGTSAPDSALTVQLGMWGKRGVRFTGLLPSANVTDSMMVVDASTGKVGYRAIPSSSSFALTNGSGTTANGTAVDWGGSATANIVVDLSSSNNFEVGVNASVGINADMATSTTTIGDYNGFTTGDKFRVNASSSLVYYDNTAHTGKFGINTPSPTVALDVVGDAIVEDAGNYHYFEVLPSTGQYGIGDLGNNTNGTAIKINDASPAVTVTTLSGTGTRGVTADASGVLGTTLGTLTSVVASADSTALSATDTNVTTYTPGSDGSYQVLVYSDITAISAATLTITCNYTDTHSNTRTATFYGMGTTTAGIGALGSSNFPPIGLLRVKGGTAITVVSTFTGVSITYDVSAKIIAL